MSAAGMTVKWHEVVKTRLQSTNTESLPLFMGVFSSEKGPEEMTDLTANDFFNLYGKKADFFKYGQPLLQAHNILNAGGRFLGYRICADDATLANIIICAEVESKEVQKTDANGQPLYIGADGAETTTVTDTIATVTVANVKYTIKTVSNVKTYEQVVAEAEKVATATLFPILVITDNGRGVSVKKVKITADHTLSKTLNFCMYNLIDVEETKSIVESTRFSMNPDVIYNIAGTPKSLNLIKNSTTQFMTYMNQAQITSFVAKLAEITGYSAEELLNNDLLFGKTRKGVALDNITIDTENGVDLSNAYGIKLTSGSNGEFGDAPFPGETATEAWTNAAIAYFNGDKTDEIYDYDLHKVDFVCDANYPDTLKKKIATLVNWRKDCFFFRDLGTGIWTYNDVYAKVNPSEWTKSPFIGDYMTTYEIVDPYSKKQIRVTMMYDFSALLVGYYATRLSTPLAGTFNGFEITSAVEGTINYIPRYTPTVSYKDLLDELRVNFACPDEIGGPLVVQSLYTSQNHYGPLSFASNTIITQMAVKSIRTYVPKIRFQIMDSADFSKYQALIDDNVLSAYKKFFKSVALVYTKDPEMSAQKIFAASLECYYKDFPQSELFDVFAIDGDPDDSASDYTLNVTDIE